MTTQATSAPAAGAATPAPAAAPAAANPNDKKTPAGGAPATVFSGDPAAPGTGGGGGAASPAAPVQGNWGDDWRTRAARGNADVVKQIERYESPEAIVEALIETKKKLSSTRPEITLAANATAEQVAEYRKAKGIPETPEGYKIEPGEGRVIGDEDKPIVDQIVKSLHGRHATPAEVNHAVSMYFDLQDQQIAERAERDVGQMQAMQDTLNKEYGGEYRGNIEAVKGLLNSMPDGVGAELRNARLADGTALLNNVSVVRALVKIATTLNPLPTLVPGVNNAAAMGDRLKELRSMMADGNSKYNAGTREEQAALRAEYEKLVDAEKRYGKAA